MYIQLHETLLSHHKLEELSRLVKKPLVRIRGHIITLWLNVGLHRPTGCVSDWTDTALAAYSGWTSDAGTWRKSLRKVGLLDEGDKIHDWEDFFSGILLANARRRERDKKRRQRARRK